LIAKRVSSLYERRLRSYVYWKIRMDPSYPAVAAQLRGREHEPLLDLGCGAGLLSFYLRESGFTAPITGIDFDARKIDAARRASRVILRREDAEGPSLEFICADATKPLPQGRNVVVLDLLQYVNTAAQQQILRNVAQTVPKGGIVVMRQGIRDDSRRYKFTHLVDTIGRAIRWNRGEPMNFPTREEIVGAFDGFTATITPMWGRTPYNNYLFVFVRN
jgi:2-polyprenyl-3-methyl-5-hydroxy-6-metoxy-1,4-benzoquinol methylase